MKFIAACLLLFIGVACIAEEQRWNESVRVFFTVANVTDESLIDLADSVLASLAFHRDSSGTRYPDGLVPGIFASYKASPKAAAMLVEAAREGCLVFSATNYDRGSEGLVARAGNAIEDRLKESFKSDVQFFSDERCAHAL